MNPFYNPSGNPSMNSKGLSAVIRAEFVSISTAFDKMPTFTTTGVFQTIFNQQGSYTFTLPAASGTLAMMADVAAETTRATAAEANNAIGVSGAFTSSTAENLRAVAAEAAEKARAMAAEAAIVAGLPAAINAYLAGLPRALPATAGQAWLNGGVVCVS